MVRTKRSAKAFRLGERAGSRSNRWDSVTIDSRDSAFTNKAQIHEWLEDYGEDSDFFRVRVRGLPPAASDLQFIDTQWDVRGMLEPHLHTLAALIAAQPDRTLAELKDALATPASVPTVWRAVRALGLTVKKNGPPVRTRSA